MISSGRARALGCTLFVALGSACPFGDPGPEPGEDCLAYMPSGDLSMLPTREVEIGQGTGASFTPWTEGGTAPVEIGGQGFEMLTPSVRLLGASAHEARECLWVNLKPVTATGEDAPDGVGWFEGGLVFEGEGDTRTAGPIFSPLDYLEPGEMVYFELTVASESFAAQQMIGVVPTR